MSAVGDDQPAGGDLVPKIVAEATEVVFAWGSQDPPEPLDRGRWRVAGVVLKMEENLIASATPGRLSKSGAFIAGGHEIFGTGDAPFEQREGLLVLVSPIQQVLVELGEPVSDVTLAGAESVDAEDHSRH